MNARDKIRQDIISFIVDSLALEHTLVTGKTRLRQDLGVDGEDADILIINLADIYGIDLSEFRSGDYFSPRPGIGPFWSAVLSLFGNARRLKVLTIDDLVGAAIRKSLK
jgi:acyl carrier protein